MEYSLEDIRQLEVELELNPDVNFIDYVRELHLLKEQTELFFGSLREIIFLAEEVYRKEQ